MMRLIENFARGRIGCDDDGRCERRAGEQLDSIAVIRMAEGSFAACDAMADEAHRMWEPFGITCKSVCKMGKQDEMTSLQWLRSGLYLRPTQSKIRGRSTEARTT